MRIASVSLRKSERKLSRRRLQYGWYSFLIEMAVQIHRSGLSIREIPILFVDRRHGVSKLPRMEILRALNTLWRLYRTEGPSASRAEVC